MKVVIVMLAVMSVCVCLASTNATHSVITDRKAMARQSRNIQAEEQKAMSEKYKDLTIESVAGYRFGEKREGWRKEVFSLQPNNEDVVLEKPIRHFTTVRFRYDAETGVRNSISLIASTSGVDGKVVAAEMLAVKKIVERRFGIEMKEVTEKRGLLKKVDVKSFVFVTDKYRISIRHDKMLRNVMVLEFFKNLGDSVSVKWDVLHEDDGADRL